MYQKENEELKREVARLNVEVERLSVDAVTGLAGRGVLDRTMVTSFARSKRLKHPMGVLMVDIDNFKKVNDSLGHQAGDMILSLIASTLLAHTRGADTLARYGGEEFAVVVDDANSVGLAVLADNMREAVDDVILPGYPVVTVSIGWSIQTPEDKSAADILARADAAMYEAKASGRNRVRRG